MVRRHIPKYCHTCAKDSTPDTESPSHCGRCLRQYTNGSALLDEDGIRIAPPGQDATYPCVICGEARSLKASLSCGRCTGERTEEGECEMDASVHWGVVRVSMDANILEFTRRLDYEVVAKPKVIRGNWSTAQINEARVFACAAICEDIFLTK